MGSSDSKPLENNKQRSNSLNNNRKNNIHNRSIKNVKIAYNSPDSKLKDKQIKLINPQIKRNKTIDMIKNNNVYVNQLIKKKPSQHKFIKEKSLKNMNLQINHFTKSQSANKLNKKQVSKINDIMVFCDLD